MPSPYIGQAQALLASLHDDVYAHLLPDMGKAAALAMGRALRGSKQVGSMRVCSQPPLTTAVIDATGTVKYGGSG